MVSNRIHRQKAAILRHFYELASVGRTFVNYVSSFCPLLSAVSIIVQISDPRFRAFVSRNNFRDRNKFSAFSFFAQSKLLRHT